MIRISKNTRKPYSQRRKEGQCYHCSEPATAGRYCWRCWVKNTAFNHFGSRSRAPELIAQWELQKGRCYYSGASLEAGVNASLCRLTTSDFCWTTKDLARMKDGLSDREFLALCRVVLDHRSKR